MEMAKSLECYGAYERLAKRKVRQSQGTDGVLWEELNDAVCRDVHIRIPTGHRYLRELTARLSSSAPFRVETKNGERRVFMRRSKDQGEVQSTEPQAPEDPPQGDGA
jgi:hypothetical protein